MIKILTQNECWTCTNSSWACLLGWEGPGCVWMMTSLSDGIGQLNWAMNTQRPEGTRLKKTSAAQMEPGLEGVLATSCNPVEVRRLAMTSPETAKGGSCWWDGHLQGKLVPKVPSLTCFAHLRIVKSCNGMDQEEFKSCEHQKLECYQVRTYHYTIWDIISWIKALLWNFFLLLVFMLLFPRSYFLTAMIHGTLQYNCIGPVQLPLDCYAVWMPN